MFDRCKYIPLKQTMLLLKDKKIVYTFCFITVLKLIKAFTTQHHAYP